MEPSWGTPSCRDGGCIFTPTSLSSRGGTFGLACLLNSQRGAMAPASSYVVGAQLLWGPRTGWEAVTHTAQQLQPPGRAGQHLASPSTGKEEHLPRVQGRVRGPGIAIVFTGLVQKKGQV